MHFFLVTAGLGSARCLAWITINRTLIVGLIMGLAVIPTIFSIAEDAVYAVPTISSECPLALGATEWQTLVKVVLLTASPGIFCRNDRHGASGG